MESYYWNYHTYTWLSIEFPFDIALDASLWKSWYPCLYFKYLSSLRVFLKDCVSLLYILTADVLRIISSMYTVEGDFIIFKSYSKRAVLGVVRNVLPRLSSRGKSLSGKFSCSYWSLLLSDPAARRQSCEERDKIEQACAKSNFGYAMTHADGSGLTQAKKYSRVFKNHPYFLSLGVFQKYIHSWHFGYVRFSSAVWSCVGVSHNWWSNQRGSIFLAHDFNVDVSSSIVLAGYFHIKSSIKYVTFNELSKNWLSKRENWIETTARIKILFLITQKRPHLGLDNKSCCEWLSVSRFQILFTMFNDTKFVNNILCVFLMNLTFFSFYTIMLRA